MEELSTDVLVAGGGVAGLRAATRAAGLGCKVVLVQRGAAASPFLHAVNAAFAGGPQDDQPPALFANMMAAGGFINEPRLVALLSQRAEAEVRYYESIGVEFVKVNGQFARRQAAGSTRPRGVYTQGSAGALMMARMREQVLARPGGIRLFDNGSLLRLTTGANGVAGGMVWDGDRETWLAVKAKAVVLATGGASQLYAHTTQPPTNLGEGYAMALEAGAELVDMEFVCFEPTVVRAPAFGRKTVSTTLFKEGGTLRNSNKEAFIDTTVPVTKDVMSRAMQREIAEGRGTPDGAVLFDLRGVPADVLEGYHEITRGLKNLGLTHHNALVPVAPTFHYLCGGVRVDGECRSAVPGLFAAGEACGGVHGAHRIAGGAGTDVMVTGAKAGESAAGYALQLASAPPSDAAPKVEALDALRKVSPEEAEALRHVREAMEAGAGISRDANSLQRTLDVIQATWCTVSAQGQAGRTLLLSQAVAAAALMRTESRGDHYRSDYPARDDLQWFGNVVVTRDGGDLKLAFAPAGLAVRETA